jgi:hypothetical protein
MLGKSRVKNSDGKRKENRRIPATVIQIKSYRNSRIVRRTDTPAHQALVIVCTSSRKLFNTSAMPEAILAQPFWNNTGS